MRQALKRSAEEATGGSKHVVDDSDSDDDLPLGQLSKEKKPKAKPTAPKKVSLVGSLHAHEALATSDL